LTGCKRRKDPASDGPRVVALSPAVAVMLRDLGLADRVVGRHGYDMVLPETLPVCGNQLGIDYERLIGAKPTHVITEWGASGPPERLVTLAAERGWKLHDSSMRTLADIRRECEEIERFVRGGPERSPELIARMNNAWSKQDKELARVGRVLMLAEIAPPAALGPGSFHFEILASLGGVPAITDGGPYQSLTLEQIAVMKPDAVVLVLPRAPGEPSLCGDAAAARRALGKIAELDVPAVTKSRYALLDDPLAQTPSTAMIGFSDELHALLKQWAEAK
ncbi:MAG: ABC transporter substrate-binding protein, partial [Phycisphaerales bacterium]